GVVQEDGSVHQFGQTCGAVAVNALERLHGRNDWRTHDVTESVEDEHVYSKYRHLFKPCVLFRERLGSADIYDLLNESSVPAQCKNMDVFLENVTSDLLGKVRNARKGVRMCVVNTDDGAGDGFHWVAVLYD